MRKHGGGGFRVRVVTYIYKHLDGTTRCGFGGIQSSGLVYGVSVFLSFVVFFFFSILLLWRCLNGATQSFTSARRYTCI